MSNILPKIKMQKCKLNFLLRFGLISILLGLFVTQSFAQNVTITGVVKDQSGEPLIGVNVMEKGTTNGSITDVDGKYSVSVKGGRNHPSVLLHRLYLPRDSGWESENAQRDDERRHGRTGRSGCDRLRHGQEEGLDGGDLACESGEDGG